MIKGLGTGRWGEGETEWGGEGVQMRCVPGVALNHTQNEAIGEAAVYVSE